MTTKRSERVDSRYQQCCNWLSEIIGEPPDLQMLAGDASFRRYFRLRWQEQTFVVMDAPPQQEQLLPFIAVAEAWRQHDVLTPTIIAAELSQGFLLLSDFGDQQLLSVLAPKNVFDYYRLACDEIIKIQSCPTRMQNYALPNYSAELLQQELELFSNWYCQQHLKRTITSVDQSILDVLFAKLISLAKSQPQCSVHRDFHSSNLLVTTINQLAVLDFQDAVIGPITYDLVSMLRDCYVAWPINVIQRVMRDFFERLKAVGYLPTFNYEDFTAWFDWLGLQRHLKCLGIFCRLNYRDKKYRYLSYLPRVLGYVDNVLVKYPEFVDFRGFMLSLRGGSK